MKTTTIPCGKCEGLGAIEAFRTIAAGVCFACNGRGTKTVRADRQPTRKFFCVYDGVELFTKSAKSENAALALAIGHWKAHRDSPALRGIVSEIQISVRAWS